MYRPAERAAQSSRAVLLVLAAILLGVASALASVVAPTPALAAEPCWDSVRSDLDGGGPDIVVGLPSFDLPGKPDAGAIVVYSNVAAQGSPNPRAPVARTVLTANDLPG
jgi:hypothetical protein